MVNSQQVLDARMLTHCLLCATKRNSQKLTDMEFAGDFHMERQRTVLISRKMGTRLVVIAPLNLSPQVVSYNLSHSVQTSERWLDARWDERILVTTKFGGVCIRCRGRSRCGDYLAMIIAVRVPRMLYNGGCRHCRQQSAGSGGQISASTRIHMLCIYLQENRTNRPRQQGGRASTGSVCGWITRRIPWKTLNT